MSDITVRPLTPAMTGDYLAFFDHEQGLAFSDNPEWARCYCHYYEVAPAIDWKSLTPDQNRVAMQSRIETGEMEGFLAYAGNQVIGWLNAQPRHKLPHCFARMRIEPLLVPCADYEAALVVCFVVAPTWRRRGVARELLTAALASFAARGIKIVDAFPFKAPASELAADHYHGPLAMFLAAGFSLLREEQSLTIVRKLLL